MTVDEGITKCRERIIAAGLTPGDVYDDSDHNISIWRVVSKEVAKVNGDRMPVFTAWAIIDGAFSQIDTRHILPWKKD